MAQKKNTDPTQLSLSLFGEVENASSNHELILAKLGKQIRTGVHPKTGNPCVLAMDLIGAWTDSPDPRTYWKVLKHRLISEGNQTVTNCNQLKFLAEDGKMRMMDVLEIEDALRVVQSIPSPKAEPIKQWLAQLGKERIEETIDPELGISRARERAKKKYEKMGYTDKQIKARFKEIDVRNEYTDELKAKGLPGDKYGVITAEGYKAWAGITPSKHKDIKGLKKEQNLRDHHTDFQRICSELQELTATELLKQEQAKGLSPCLEAAKRGGAVAKDARNSLEKAIGIDIITEKKLLERRNYNGKT